MIEAASRSLRQQIDHGAARDRPCSNGLFHDGAPGTIPAGSAGWQGIHTDEPRSMESAQRRIRSAENQHRMVSAARDGLPMGSTVASTPSTSALDNYPLEDEVEDDTAALTTPLEDATSRMFPTDFHPELKRPLSRKKDPSASAAAGLGAFAGPSKMTDAFEQRKARQPIPVESWGPRPPSRAGMPQKASAPLDAGLGDVLLSTPSRASGPGSSVGRPSSQAGGQSPGSRPSSKGPGSSVGRPSSQAGGQSPSSRPSSKVGGEQALGSSKVTGGTWAAARSDPRVPSEVRRGRERKAANRDRGSPEVGYAAAADLGVFGCGTRAPTQQLTKSLSGVFDAHTNQFRGPAAAPSRTSGQGSTWADEPAALEVSGCGLGEPATAAWPGGPAQSCSGSPPTRKGPRHSLAEPVSVEDVEAEQDHTMPSRRGDATSPQVIVTRSRDQAEQHQRRGQVRRNTEQCAPSNREPHMPFSTSLDVDFLSLFAS